MTTTAIKSPPSWQAEVKWERRYYALAEKVPEVGDGTPEDEIGETPGTRTVETIHTVRECFVDIFKPGGARIRFRVNHRKGRDLTFTDPREQWTGTAGTRGPWGTLPEQPAGKPRSLTPTGFREEVERLIGSERRQAIIREIVA